MDKFAKEQQAIDVAEREVENLKALVKSKAFWKRAKGFWKEHHPMATAAEIANEQVITKARFSKEDERMHGIEEQMISEVKDPTAINAALKEIAEAPSMQHVLSDLRALDRPAKLSLVSPKPCNPGLQLGCNAITASQSEQNINKRQEAKVASLWVVSMRFHLHFARNRSSK